jgi:hypothetical protein
MAEEKKVKSRSTPYYVLRGFWRKNRKNKKKLEKWVDDNTDFGSVPVFLRSGGPDLHPEILADLKVYGSK